MHLFVPAKLAKFFRAALGLFAHDGVRVDDGRHGIKRHQALFQLRETLAFGFYGGKAQGLFPSHLLLCRDGAASARLASSCRAKVWAISAR